MDVPSAWDVNQGNINSIFSPNMLISIMFPKLCAINFDGIHYY